MNLAILFYNVICKFWERIIIFLISTNLKNFLISLKSFFEKTFCNYSPNKSFLSLSHSQKSFIINLKKNPITRSFCTMIHSFPFVFETNTKSNIDFRLHCTDTNTHAERNTWKIFFEIEKSSRSTHRKDCK